MGMAQCSGSNKKQEGDDVEVVKASAYLCVSIDTFKTRVVSDWP
jgi:hypothetical protein